MNFKVGNLEIARQLLAGAALAGLLVVGGVQVASADDHHGCQIRIERAELRLDRAVDRNGPRSWQARSARSNLSDVRATCWRENHGWWDGHAHMWHTDHW